MVSSTPSFKLSNLPLRPSTLSILERHGFVYSSELVDSKQSGGLSNLAAELGCSLTEASSLYREVESCLTIDEQNHAKAQTALELVSKQQTSQRTIVTFSKSFDQLLGGGISRSEVTEISGLPGVGKTQLCMQLCVDARLPIPFGGVAGESVYIDTEGSFSPERCHTMAKELVDHVHRAAQRRKTSSSSVPAWFTPETILEGTHVYRVHDEAALTATIHTLPDFLQEREEAGSPVRLVIVDSIAFHYRCDTADYMARTRSLTSLAAFLADLANSHNVAVVVVNQMTTKVGAQGDFKYVPALGESWAHATTTRLLLSSATHADDPSVRQCTLLKSPHKATGTALFQVRECGVRDPPLQDASKRQRQG